MTILKQEKYLSISQNEDGVASAVERTFREHNGSVPLDVFQRSLKDILKFDPSEIKKKEEVLELISRGKVFGTTFFYPIFYSIKGDFVYSGGFYRI